MNGRERAKADRFLRGVRRDFANQDDPELACTCGMCWHENFASIRALQAVAAPGMGEQELTLAVWEWMHSDEGPWAGRQLRR